MTTLNDTTAQIIEEFRSTGGKVDGVFARVRLLLLTTTRDGVPRTTPLTYLPDGERVLLVAAGDTSADRDWLADVRADPTVTVDNGVSTYEGRAVVLEGSERDTVLPRVLEAGPVPTDRETSTGDDLAVVALTEVPGPPRFNAGSLGAALKLLHDAFRRELALIREEVVASGPRLGAQLRVNCLTVCHGLHYHHTSEDTGMFVFLAEHHPELGPTLERLRGEHTQMAALLDELQQVLAAEDVAPGVVAGEVERLSDALEAHLAFEEEQLIPTLDTVTFPG